MKLPAVNINHDDLVHYFHLTPEDLAEVTKQRSAASRLGFALQLCTLRYFGYLPSNLSELGGEITGYVASQLDISPTLLGDYGERTRREHQQPILDHAGYRRAEPSDVKALRVWLKKRALEHDTPELLFNLACDYLKARQLVRLGVTRLERLVSAARATAQRDLYGRLTQLLTPDLKTLLDSLLEVDVDLGFTRLAWLQARPRSVKLSAILSVLDKLDYLHDLSVQGWDLSFVNPSRMRALAKIGQRATNQYLQRANPERRYPILLAFLKESLSGFTDDALEMLSQYLWETYKKAGRSYQADRLEATKAMNEQLRTTQELLKVLLDPDVKDGDVRDAVFHRVSAETLQVAFERNETLIRTATTYTSIILLATTDLSVRRRDVCSPPLPFALRATQRVCCSAWSSSKKRTRASAASCPATRRRSSSQKVGRFTCCKAAWTAATTNWLPSGRCGRNYGAATCTLLTAAGISS